MKLRLLALSAALALTAGSVIAAEGAPAPAAGHRFVAPAGQEGEDMVGFVDMASLRRSGMVAEAEGILVPLDGMDPYPNLISARMRVDCSNRMASVFNTRITSAAGADRGAADVDLEPEPLDEDDEATFALFCRAGADRGLQSFPSVQAAVAHVRSNPSRWRDDADEDDEAGDDDSGSPPAGKD